MSVRLQSYVTGEHFKLIVRHSYSSITLLALALQFQGAEHVHDWVRTRPLSAGDGLPYKATGKAGGFCPKHRLFLKTPLPY